MEMDKKLFTSPSKNPLHVKLMRWGEIESTFDVIVDDEELTQSVARSVVLVSEDHAIKILQDSDPDLVNELRVGNALNKLSRENLTHVFGFTHGYVLSFDLPPHVSLARISLNVPGRGYVDVSAHHYVYMFLDLHSHSFADLPDDPKINEDYYFEMLIGIYYARMHCKFSHHDVHTGNLMFRVAGKKHTRTYKIADFYVSIQKSDVEPKLIDFGKSVVDSNYSDEKWKDPAFKRFWDKSDVLHLSVIFERRNLSDRFRQFLSDEVFPKYASSRYATKLEFDSAANFKNIENLLEKYFGRNQTVDCMVCNAKANYRIGSMLFFCGEPCRILHDKKKERKKVNYFKKH
jgi:hypothetical protein